MLDPAELPSRLGRWLEALRERTDDDQVCIDGKSLRAAFDQASGKSPATTAASRSVRPGPPRASNGSRAAMWAGLRTLVVQRAGREVVGGRRSTRLRYYISTRPAKGVERLGRAARNQGSVENELHCVLDMVFDEDHSHPRRDNAAFHLAAMRRVALVLLKKDTSRKVCIATKRRRAGWDRRYLTRFLLGP